jgi:hypothetical protein
MEAIALYGDAYAEKVLKNFFASKSVISGQEILTLCNVQQVNLFVIRELFRAWREETRRQKSSYFDYEHPEVKEALTTFMTVLSNHIQIGQPHFAPLLKKAVSQTLMAIFDPYDFYSMLITGKNNKLEVAPFKEEIKYLKVNKAPLEKMLLKLEEKNVTEIPGNEAFAVLDQILEEVNFTPEDLDDYIERFSSVLPLDPNRFYVKSPEPPKAETLPPPVNHATHKEEPVVKNEIKAAEPTVNERINKVRQPAVLDTLTKISRIKDSLSINQKFMFTKVLFFGDFESFSRAIDELDKLNSMKEALDFLDGYSAAWDRDSKEFHEFMELVEKRFS